jgi:nucleoside-diphosphate-sugar epimerase
MRILVTGASGCVGRSLVAALLAGGHDLVLCVRKAERLPEAVRGDPRVEVVEGDLRELAGRPGLGEGVAAAVLVATAWGGPDTTAITRDANAALTDRLLAAGCGHILYFATASVLGRDGALLPEAEALGTEYIRAKAGLVRAMEERAGRGRITGLFPTLVLGGRLGAGPEAAPPSHLARLLGEARRWRDLVRMLSFRDGRFHLIHADDIAAVVRRLIEQAPKGTGAERVVLGNPAMGVDEVLAEAARAWGRRYRGWVRVTPRRADWLIRTFRIRLTPWDRWCLEHPDQSFPGAVWPRSLGLEPVMPDLATGIRLVGAA